MYRHTDYRNAPKLKQDTRHIMEDAISLGRINLTILLSPDKHVTANTFAKLLRSMVDLGKSETLIASKFLGMIFRGNHELRLRPCL
jgi:hypothetical protein